MSGNILTDQVLELLKKISEKKIYGSVEIYFEDGKVTQITQRVIKKIGVKREKSGPIEKISMVSVNNKTTDLIEDSLIDLMI